MTTTMVREQIPSVQSVQAQPTSTVILQVGDSLARLTARQARQLASMLVVQAEAVAPKRTNAADSLLVEGWFAQPLKFRGGTHRKVLVACRASRVRGREAHATLMP